MVLQAIKDAGDVFPPVKSAAAAVIVVWEMSRVSATVFLRRALHDCFVLQRTRSNRKDCEHLADRAAEIVQCIWAQTKHYRRGDLSVEVEQSINRIARSVSIYRLRPSALLSWHHRIFEDIVVFLEELNKQSLVNRFARQDENTKKIKQFSKSLEEAMQDFSVRPARCASTVYPFDFLPLQINLQMSLLRQLTAFQEAHREQHTEVIGAAQMTEREREVREISRRPRASIDHWHFSSCWKISTHRFSYRAVRRPTRILVSGASW